MGHFLILAEEERFELSREIAPPYSFSKAAPSATWVLLRVTSTRWADLLYHARGGEGEIRTLGTGLAYTRFPVVLLQPLGHLSVK